MTAAADTIRSLFLDIVSKQLSWHSSIKMPDVYLIARQAAFGPPFGPSDHCSRTRLEREWNSGLRICRQDRLIEVIDPWGDIIRLHIRLFRKSGGSLGILERLCRESAGRHGDGDGKMELLLDLLTDFSRSHAINCNAEEIAAYTAVMRRNGYPPVAHSEEYTAANYPCYCLILTRLWEEEFIAHKERYKRPLQR